MSELNIAEQGSATAMSPKWSAMSFGGKIVFAVKLVIFLCTFGFAYPRLLTD